MKTANIRSSFFRALGGVAAVACLPVLLPFVALCCLFSWIVGGGDMDADEDCYGADFSAVPLIVAVAAVSLCLVGCEEWNNHGDAAAKDTAGLVDPNDPLPPGAVSWCYGSFKGGGARRVSECQIANLRVTSSGLSYSWVRGGCEALGAPDASAAACIAAVFYQAADGSWKGGKFDWISTSRRSRTFTNIRGGYGGWNAAEFFAARKHAFVIVSGDGKKRSNWIFD